jgi:hypothetical protein
MFAFASCPSSRPPLLPCNHATTSTLLPIPRTFQHHRTFSVLQLSSGKLFSSQLEVTGSIFRLQFILAIPPSFNRQPTGTAKQPGGENKEYHCGNCLPLQPAVITQADSSSAFRMSRFFVFNQHRDPHQLFHTETFQCRSSDSKISAFCKR